MELFTMQDYELELNKPEILLVKEFADLWETNRNKGAGDNRGYEKKRAFKEFSFIYLVYDWKSPYSEYSDQEKREAAQLDSTLTNKQLEDDKFIAACRKYQEMQDSRILKLLRSAYRATDELRIYFDNIDLQERDPETGKPIYAAKDLIASISALGKTVEGLEQLEYMVKKEKEKERGLRGGQEAGMFD
jgi:hypothetical protein